MRVEPAIEIFSSRTPTASRACSRTIVPTRKRAPGLGVPGLGVKAGSVACFLLLMGVPGGLLAARRPVVEALPFMAGIYSSIGLPINLRGLEITALFTRLEEQGGGRVLLVEGNVSNVSSTSVPVPALTLALRSADGAVLYSWTAASPRSQLDVADRMTFRTRLVSPPDGARDVRVAFR